MICWLLFVVGVEGSKIGVGFRRLVLFFFGVIYWSLVYKMNLNKYKVYKFDMINFRNYVFRLWLYDMGICDFVGWCYRYLFWIFILCF